MFIVFIGPPGAGKGTQSRRLLDYLKIPHLSTGEMLRAAKQVDPSLGQLAAQYMDGGRLVPDPIVMNIVGKRLDQPDCARGCLFDGFPRTIQQAKSLDETLAARGTRLDVVIELLGDENVLVARMLKRAAAEGRADDNPQTISQRMEVYRKQTFPLLNYYRTQGILSTFDALRHPDEVFADIRHCIDQLKNR